MTGVVVGVGGGLDSDSGVSSVVSSANFGVVGQSGVAKGD